jgi:hypothetical protein
MGSGEKWNRKECSKEHFVLVSPQLIAGSAGLFVACAGVDGVGGK